MFQYSVLCGTFGGKGLFGPCEQAQCVSEAVRCPRPCWYPAPAWSLFVVNGLAVGACVVHELGVGVFVCWWGRRVVGGCFDAELGAQCVQQVGHGCVLLKLIALSQSYL